MKNVNSMTAHAIRELHVGIFDYLTGTNDPSRLRSLRLLTLAWHLKVGPAMPSKWDANEENSWEG